MKRKKVIIYVFLLLILCGCGKEENPYGFDTTLHSTTTVEQIKSSTDATESATETPKITEGLSMKYYAAGEGMAEKLGVDKTLVFVTYYITTRGIDSRIFETFNELLVNKYGCDFVVEFRGYDFVSNEKLYQEEIREMKELNVQTDILCVGQLTGANMGDACGNAIRDGLLEPLNLWFGTEWGKILESSYPPELWERVSRDGECYGTLRGYTSVASAVTFINDKYINGAVEVNSIKTVDDLLSYVKTIENIDEDVVPLAVDAMAFDYFNGYYNFYYGNHYGLITKNGAGIYARNVEGKWKAFFALNDEEYINNLIKIRDYSFAKGIDSATAIDTGKFAAAIAYAEVRDFDDNNMIIYEKNNEKVEMPVTVGEVYPSLYEIIESNITGIASWSEYKEEAIQLFALIASEPELANLLTYGLEGIHYEVVDGKVNWLDYDGNYGNSPIWLDSIANMCITYPYGLETENKEQRYRETEATAELGVKSKYDIDVSAYEETLVQMAKLMTKYDGWLYKDNYMELLEEQRKQMKELGIDEIVAEINRQLNEAQK